MNDDDVKVKLCGMTKPEGVILCMNFGADVLGFVTEYPVQVPWNLKSDEAERLISYVKKPHRSCVVTGGTPEKVINLAKRLKPSLVQLHYKETLKDTKIISAELKSLGIETIKTVPPGERERLDMFQTTDLADIVESLCQTDVFALLVDSRNPNNASGRGRTTDLSFYLKVRDLSTKPVILAGGITPENVFKILERTNAGYIDIMTGIEEVPGVKDENKVQKLFEELRKFRGV